MFMLGGGSLSYVYDGDGAITATSSDTSIATVVVNASANTITVTYVSAGSATITVSAAETSKYKAAEATSTVTCKRTSVGIPYLNSTSVAWVGSSVSPGVSNINWNLVTQSGTTSANGTGTWTVYWSLKDTNAYCWSDGTTGTKSQSWSTYVGTITFYVLYSSAVSTFSCTYGTTWAGLNDVRGTAITVGTTTYNAVVISSSSSTRVQIKIAPKITSSTWRAFTLSGVTPDSVPSNGVTYTN